MNTIQFPQDDFKALDSMVNSPKQEARRQARLQRDRLLRRRDKAISVGGIFSAGIIFMWLLTQLV